MQVQSLVSLWFGLALPIILAMYLLKRKYIDTQIPSHLLWNRVLRDIEANRPWQKLRNNLLLLLQLLIAALLVLALLQPYIWTNRSAGSPVIIVLDRSASMDALNDPNKPENTWTNLDEAKMRISDFVAANAGSSPITLITMGEQPEVLVAHELEMDTILSAIQKVKPYYGSVGYKETLSLAAALTQEDKTAIIQVYTDGLWTENTAGILFRAPVQIEQIGSGQLENAGIVQFGVKLNAASDTTSAASMVSGVASLKNWGATQQEVEVTLYTDGEISEVRREILQPSKQKSLYYDRLKSAVHYKLAISSKNDALAIDNTSYAFLTGERPRKALLVSPGNLFLEKALQLAGVEVIKVQSGTNEPLVIPRSEVDFVVIDSIDQTAFAPKPWQLLLAQKPVWYLHSGLQGGDINPPHAAYQIDEHPLTTYIQLQDTHIAKMMQVEQVAWGKPVIRIGNQPLVFAGLENGKPRLLFTFDLHQSDLPLRSEFPILVQNAVTWLNAGEQHNLGRSMVGSKLDISLAAGTISASWLPLEITTGISLSNQPAEQQGGAISSSQTVPNQPGLYQFVEKDAAAKETKRYLEVASDPKESNIDLQPELEMNRLSPETPSASPNTTSNDITEKTLTAKTLTAKTPYDLIKWVALLVLIMLFVEWGVYQRGTSVK